MKVITGTFRDKRGSECIEIKTTGTSLAVTIRGVAFTGREFDSLTPAHETDAFDLCHGDLCGCELNMNIPMRLVAPDGVREITADAKVILGSQGPRGGLDKEDVSIRLVQPEFSIESRGTSGYFEDELLSLVAQLPTGFRLEACITCGLSDYSPAGNGSFGCLACFRDTADEYRKVHSKTDIFALWDNLTEYVQETHFCPKYETRPKGCGYRG